MTIAETPRLTLRRMTSDDAPFVIELLNDRDFVRFIGDKQVRTEQDALHYIETGPVASYERFGFGLFVVILRASATPIGICGLLQRDVLEDVDLGFAFLPAFRGLGYAREAALATLDFARALSIARVAAIAQPDNVRSIRLLEAIGFAHERYMQLSPDGPELTLMTVRL